MVVIFDMMGTIFSLRRIRSRMQELDLAPELLPWWFARLLQCSMAATLAAKYYPFREVAQTTLKQILDIEGKPAAWSEPLLRALEEVEPWPETEACLKRMREVGFRLFLLTNSSKPAAEKLLERAGLQGFFEGVFSTDEVQAAKPDPRSYQLALETVAAPGEACLVAAHAWDVLGAHGVGMKTVWVSHLEKCWTFPGDPPGELASGLAEVPDVVTRIAKALRHNPLQSS